MSLLEKRQRAGAVYACACVHGGWTDINTGTCIYWFSTRLASVRGAICQWVGCLIGNQYVCLDSFLLIIVLFSTVQLICSKVLLLAFWPFHLNFHGWLVSYHYNMSKNLILYILCQNIMSGSSLFVYSPLWGTPQHCFKFIFITDLLTLLPADKCDKFSVLTCKMLVFYQRYTSRISEADRIRHIRNSWIGSRGMPNVIYFLNDNWSVDASTDRDTRGELLSKEREQSCSCSALCVSVL